MAHSLWRAGELCKERAGPLTAMQSGLPPLQDIRTTLRTHGSRKGSSGSHGCINGCPHLSRTGPLHGCMSCAKLLQRYCCCNIKLSLPGDSLSIQGMSLG